MDDAKLLEFEYEFDESDTYCSIQHLRITYAGYQFLAASRDNSIWKKIKGLSAPVAVELAKTLAVEGGKAFLKLN